MKTESYPRNQFNEDSWPAVCAKYNSNDDLIINFLRENSETTTNNFNQWNTIYVGALFMRETQIGEPRKEMEQLQIKALKEMEKSALTFEQKRIFYSIAVLYKDFETDLLRKTLEDLSVLVTTPEQQEIVNRRWGTFNKTPKI